MHLVGGIEVGLGLLFGCLLLALSAELFYLLRRKRSISDIEHGAAAAAAGNYRDAMEELLDFLCWKRKKPQSQSQSQSYVDTTQLHNPTSAGNNPQALPGLEAGSGKESPVKEGEEKEEESVEAELMRLHNLRGPPRFLYTINEETKEDLESEDCRSRRGSRTRSLSDTMVIVAAMDSPFLSPASNAVVPEFNHRRQGFNFNPLFESAAEAELLNRLRSSPPPTFKFLRDAEDKLLRRMAEEAAALRPEIKNGGGCAVAEGSTIPMIVAKNKERGFQFHSGSSQVLPLSSSPYHLNFV